MKYMIFTYSERVSFPKMALQFFLSMYFLVLLSLGSCVSHAAGSVPSGNETDRLALLAFSAEITSDPFGALSSWNESVHFCQWNGVTCGRQHRRLIKLRLDYQELAGPISPHIGNLSFLRDLRLRHNRLSGVMPPEFGRLRRLQNLSLLNNSISGEIPANISSSSSLIWLELSINQLVGKIPMELGLLSKLKGLYLWRNNIIGPIPTTLGNLSSLELLEATENRISGSIPDVLGRLTKLEILSLRQNELVGTVPPSIFNLSSIVSISVGLNQLQGKLPSDLGNTCPKLRTILIYSNLFTGPIPISISNASKLQVMVLNANQLTGRVPPLEKLYYLLMLSLSFNYLGQGEANDLNFLTSLTNATYLSFLAINDNNFGGLLPECISNFSTNLMTLAISSNKISGNIPSGIKSLVNLERIEMWNNNLIGEIPSSIGMFPQLQLLSLSNNKFFGNIPLSLGNLSLLIKLYLDQNDFHGYIPSNLGKFQQLQRLWLDRNNLNGTIPREVISLPTLLGLDVSQNLLTGFLPMEVGNMRNIEVLDFSENMFSGEIPRALGSCVKLMLLHAEGNNFQGTLPPSLSYLRGMEELDFSRNNFSGKIPEFFGDFVFLQKLNLSFNDFEGMVPEKGIFNNATAIFVKGNNKLCGGIPELHLHDCDSKGSKRNSYTRILKIIIPTTFGLAGILLVLCFLFGSWFRKRTKIPSFRIIGNTFQKVSYQSLLEATDGFSQANLIGVGSFGSVYKGILKQGGKVVAVKVINLVVHGASKSFIAECKALRNIKHRNLLKVLTACSSIDYQGNDFKALVYEFMVNGSLDEWLHRNGNDGIGNENSRKLNLLQRLNIAIDVASALDYLHNHCPESIVHCDLKPSNVLLDNEMIAHVGDFGLARFFPEDSNDYFAYPSSSMGTKGTVGYVAPEYGTGNKVSTYGDIYSYGIILLEMFTGKRPTDNIFSDGLSIHDFVKDALQEQVMSGIVDPKLVQVRGKGVTSSTASSSTLPNPQNPNYASSHKTLECSISILKVGIACSEELPRDRMAIKNVVIQLHSIRKTHFGTSELHGAEKLEFQGRQE